MAQENVRVKIPKNPDDLVLLIGLILSKHVADGTTSPINNINATDFSTKANAASQKQAAALKFRKDAETSTQERDLLLGRGKLQNSKTEGTLLFYVTAIRDLLLAKYRGKEQKLADWGFVVDKSPSKKSGTGKKTE